MQVKYFVLQPDQFKLDGGAMYGIIPRPLWEKKSSPDTSGRINLALRLLLIKTDNKIILIDTGIGSHYHSGFLKRFAINSELKHPIDKCLNTLNLKRDDITDVVLSHLHFDHVGGLQAQANQLAFKNATLHLQRAHYNYANNPTKRDAGSFQTDIYKPTLESYKQNDKINWIDGDNGIILADEDYQLNFQSSNGHTPHMLHPYDKNIFYMADIAPTSNHISIPWVMGYDISPGITTQDKERLFNFAIQNNLIAIYEHDIDYWGSKLIKNKKDDFEANDKYLAQNLAAYAIF